MGRREPALTVEQILAWADAFHERRGAWPRTTSGPIPGAGLTWGGVHHALRCGRRGLPGGDTLPRLLRRYRHIPERRGRPRDVALRRRVLTLRAQGLSFDAIGDRLACTGENARQLSRRARGLPERGA